MFTLQTDNNIWVSPEQPREGVYLAYILLYLLQQHSSIGSLFKKRSWNKCSEMFTKAMAYACLFATAVLHMVNKKISESAKC